MNDFTKEELQDLLICCYGGIDDDHPVEDYKIILQKKIQSMIDNNKCSHESNGEMYIRQKIEDKCKKCGELY